MSDVAGAIGVPWFREEDYGRVLAIMEDRDTLPSTFEAWWRISEARFAGLQLQNASIRKVIVTPAALLDFCAEHDMVPDGHARAFYAALVAEGALGTD